MEPNYKNPVCRGSAVIGNNCGVCERCKFYEQVSENQLEILKMLVELQRYPNKNNFTKADNLLNKLGL